MRPSQVDALPADSVAAFRPRRPWPALLAVGIAAGVGLIWFAASSTTPAPVTIAELPPARPMAAPSPAPPAPAPAPAAVAPAPNSEAGGTVKIADSFKAALADTPGTTQVTVHVSPSDAAVFKDGRRLGRGNVTVDVAPGTKVTLIAQLDGHTPRTLVLDGSYSSINIALNRAEATQVVKSSTPSSKPKIAVTREAPSAPRDAPDNPY